MDKRQFEDLYKQHAAEIYKYCMFKLNNRENAEDVTSEAFVRLAESNLKNEDNLRAWLYQVSRNIMFDKYFKNIKLETTLDTEILESIESENYKVEDIVVEEALISKIREEINKLDSITAEIIILRIWEDLKFSEIAKILEIGENTVKFKFYNGIEKVKNNIKTEEKTKMRTIAVPVIIAAIGQIANAKEFILPANLFKNILNITILTMATTADTTAKSGGIAGLLSLTAVKIGLAIFALIVSCGGCFGFMALLNSNKTPQQPEQTQQPEQKPEEKPVETVKYKDCAIKSIGLTYKILETWKCSDKTTKDYINGEITSPKLKMHISDGGRGPYCGDGPANPGSTCDVKVFHETKYIKLQTWIYNGVGGEIFGTFKNYKDLGTEILYLSIPLIPDGVNAIKLTEKEIKEIKDMVNSFKFTSNKATYKNPKYPKFSFIYDKGLWKLDVKVKPQQGGPEITEVTLTKDGTALKMILQPVFGDGMGACYNNSYKVLKNNYARVKETNSGQTIYVYHPEIFVKNSPQWKKIVDGWFGEDYSNTAYCTNGANFFVDTLYGNVPAVYGGSFKYYPGLVSIKVSGANLDKNILEADKILKTLKYK